MVRAALWLIQEVGEGNTFTKEQVRAAFPGISQADRRIRDLREFGWVLLTNVEDATLAADEQRFERAGVPVWDPAARRAASSRRVLSATERRAIMDRDNYMCTVCGILAGEAYIEDPHKTAVLSVVRQSSDTPDGQTTTSWVTSCKRCASGKADQRSVAQVVGAIQALEPEDRTLLARWIECGQRAATPLERAWSVYSRLPDEAREEVRAILDS